MRLREFLAICLTVVVIATLVACGTNNNNTSSSSVENSAEVETTVETEPNETPSVSPEVSQEEPAEELKYFATDEIVNGFFERYNAIAATPIESTMIEKGNIRTKALVYIDDFSLEVVNSNQGTLAVSMGAAKENEETTLYEAFANSIKAMVPETSDSDIKTAWDEIHATGYMVENYDFDGIAITYVPEKELSQGHSNLRIDLLFPIE